jgi:hypothetical protein
MKSMEDVKDAMSVLYEEIRAGSTDLKTADSLANVAGKYLKAEQLKLAREVFEDGKARNPMLPPA